MDIHPVEITVGLTRAERLHKATLVFIRRLGAIGLVLLVVWFQGCRKGPCVQSLAIDKTTVLKKGELKLSVTLHEVLEGLDCLLKIAVRNDGNIRYEGSCDMIWFVSGNGMEFVIAFVPEIFDRSSILEIELNKGKALIGSKKTLLSLDPGEECEFIGYEGLRPSKDVPRPKYIGRLYTEDL